MNTALQPPMPRLRRASTAFTVLFGLLVALAGWWGWQQRGEFVLSPDHGPGYLLGIIGGLMMLALLLYPLRKHWRVMQRLGAIHHWFRLHMVLGIVGPLCVLFHCNFSLGAVNSNVALLCMALMVSSGLVGRFIYARIHHGLYGHKATLASLQDAAVMAAAMIRGSASGSGRAVTDEVLAQLAALHEYVRRPLGPLAGGWRLLAIGPRCRLLGWRLHRQLAQVSAGASSHRYVDDYLDSLRRITGFRFFDRLFSWWHTLHMPIFFMLVITGFAHVWAVHHY